MEADRANPSKFYAWSGNTFYISSDKELAFKPSAATNLPSARRFKAVYGYEGDIWLTGGSDTTPMGGGVTATSKITNEWNSGYCASIIVTNNGNTSVSWQSSLTITSPLNNIWGASGTQTGSTLSIKGLEWNAILQPGKIITDIGFCANK